jgi:hypothetical protein
VLYTIIRRRSYVFPLADALTALARMRRDLPSLAPGQGWQSVPRHKGTERIEADIKSRITLRGVDGGGYCVGRYFGQFYPRHIFDLSAHFKRFAWMRQCAGGSQVAERMLYDLA